MRLCSFIWGAVYWPISSQDPVGKCLHAAAMLFDVELLTRLMSCPCFGHMHCTHPSPNNFILFSDDGFKIAFFSLNDTRNTCLMILIDVLLEWVIARLLPS
jgi:hypothetical protein